MSIFGKNKVKLDEEQMDELEQRILGAKKFRNFKSENFPKPKIPAKPWGKKERILVLVIFVTTVFISAFLAASARNFKLPGIPKLTFPRFSLFKGETIMIGNKKPDQTVAIKTAFVEKTKNLSGIYAFYLVDLESGLSFGVNENEVMQAASLIKLPVMLYSLGRVEEAKIQALGKRSDNAVFNQLVAKFGQETLQKYIAESGMAKTSLAENKTTPKEIGDLLVKIYQDKQNSVSGNGEKILGYLTDTIFESWLRAGIPAEVKVAHKYGREVHVVNDAGIVFTENPFVLVIITDGVVEKEADAVFPELAKMIYSLYEEIE